MPRDLDLDPTLLAELDEEATFVSTLSRSKFMPRLKVERGTSVLIRFLPVEIGANKHWLGRFAQHWVHNRAIFCRKNTSIHLGGDPNYDCPICRLVENGLRHDVKAVVERAQKCGSDPRWFGIVLLWVKDDGSGRPVSIQAPECYTPYEFSMYKTMFDQLRLIASRFAIKGTKGMVDIDKGVDIWVQRTGRGYTFSPDVSKSIYEGEDDKQGIIDLIWSKIKITDVSMPAKDQEAEFFHKIKEFLITGSGGFDNARGSRGASAPSERTDNIDDNIDAVSSAPSRGGRGSFPKVAANNEDDLDAGVDAVAEPPKPTARPVVASAAEPSVAQVHGSVPQVPKQSAKGPQIASSKLIQPVANTRQVKPPIVGATPEDEEAGVAPESIDPAPPIQDNINVQPVAETPPPVVSARGTRLGAALSSRLASFQTPPSVSPKV